MHDNEVLAGDEIGAVAQNRGDAHGVVGSRSCGDGHIAVCCMSHDLYIGGVALGCRLHRGLNRNAALVCQITRVDDVDGNLRAKLDNASQRCGTQDLRVLGGDTAACLDRDAANSRRRNLRGHICCRLSSADVGTQVLHDLLGDASRVDDRRDGLALHAGNDELGDLRSSTDLGLFGGCAQMRGEDNVVKSVDGAVAYRLVLPHVDACAAYLAALQEASHSLDVHDAAACAVDKDDAVFHDGVLIGTEHARRLFGLGHVDGDEVTHAAQLVDVCIELDAHGCGALCGDIRVVAGDLHAKGLGALDNEHAHATQAKHCQGLALQLDARELGAVPVAGLHGGVCDCGLAGDGQHEGDGLLCSRDNVGGRGVADDDAALCCGLRIDVVYAYAGTADDFEVSARLDDLAGHGGGAPHDEAVVIADKIDELLWGGVGLERYLAARLFQNSDALFGQLLWDEYLHSATSFQSMGAAGLWSELLARRHARGLGRWSSSSELLLLCMKGA